MSRIVGLETEYGLVARERSRDGGWRRLAADEAGRLLFDPMAREAGSTNAFLAGGGRLYLDIGSHPEYATPECLTALDAVVADAAGDELMLELAVRAEGLAASEGREIAFALFRNNVDAWGNTWGSHENYSIDRALDPGVVAGWLVPFLVSRQLIAGAGRHRRGEYTLSQRCDTLQDVVSNQTTRARPLINTRDEPHADPARWRRLHVISGDTNPGQFSTWLKLATTLLVLRLAESGAEAPVRLLDPMAALPAWGREPGRPMACERGEATAWDVQRRWAELAGTVASGAEEERVVDAWVAVVERLASGRETEVDHDVKRRLIEAYRERYGLAAADARLDQLDLAFGEIGRSAGRPLGLAGLLAERGKVPVLAGADAVAAALAEAPSATRARLRGRLVAAAEAGDRQHSVDWARFSVSDLPGAGGVPVEVALELDDPFAASDDRVDALVDRMASEPRARTLRGFTPPGG